MFTPIDLQKLKKETQRELESDLRIVQALYDGTGAKTLELYMPYLHCLQQTTQTSKTIKPGVVTLDQFTIKLKDLNAISPKLTLESDLKPVFSGSRYDELKHIYLILEYYEPIQNITEIMIKTHTKKTLNKKFMPENKYLECSLLEQFKKGNLTMDQVITGSLEDCAV